MWIMDKIRNGLRSFLRIQPAQPAQIDIEERLDYRGNAIKNRIWYRGEAYELEQLHLQIETGSGGFSFWAGKPTPGLEIRKLHTGIPANIVDTLATIVIQNLDGFDFGDESINSLWKAILEENGGDRLLTRSIRETLVVGDGAFKLSYDPSLSVFPIIEFVPGDRIKLNEKRNRIYEIVFVSCFEKHELHEIYGRGYVRYELYREDGDSADLGEIPELSGLQNVEFGTNDDRHMWANTLSFFDSPKWNHRGKSVFDGKTDDFDALDETWSQWMNALRDGRSKTYIPESLIPRDPNTGALKRPNAFDDRFITTAPDMSQNAQNKITVEQPTIPHDSYSETYCKALDLALTGIISPSTMGIDLKRKDNAEAQREKEKVTLYTRGRLVSALEESLSLLAVNAVKACKEARNEQVPPNLHCDVLFGDYSSPSFEAIAETVGKAKAQGIMSTEAAVDELYGDSRSDEWKEEEVRRIKRENGIEEMDEPDFLVDQRFEA